VSPSECDNTIYNNNHATQVSIRWL